MISLFCIFVGILSCYLIFPPTATAQTPEPNEPVSTDNLVLTDDLEGRRNSFLDEQKNQPGPVVIDGRELFVITQSFGTQSIGDRIEIITERIINVAKEPSYAIEDVQYESVSASAQSNTTEEGDGEPKQFHGIKLKDLELLAISKADAQALNTTQDILGQEYLQIIRHTIQLYRQERSQEYLTDAAVKTLLSTGLFLISFILTALFFRGLRKSIYKKKKVVKRQGRQSSQKVRLLSYQQILSTGIRVLNFFNVVLNLIFVYFYFAYTLELYPWTRQFSRKLWDYFLYTLDFSWSAFVDYLPNLLILALIFTIARYFLSVTKSICNNLGNGNIAFPGFYPEWATPTYHLLEILIFALVTVISFPYLPGFGSPAFQGVSLFLGVLVSLGSTAAVTNGVAGIILIYTRSFQVGDRVKFGDVLGDVEEKSILATRIRTFENIIVTIPNGSLISDNIINYSASIRDTNRPVMLTAVVTLGYDVPWDLVYRTLAIAALTTNDIEQDPQPVVLQTALNDFSVTYELKAYTLNPNRMELIFSELHQNMQDYCNQAGIEILSPTYSAVRDGNYSTIPEKYLEKDYKAPGFQVNPIGNLFQFDMQMQARKKNKSRS